MELLGRLPQGFVLRLRDIRYKQLQQEQQAAQRHYQNKTNVNSTPLSKFTTAGKSPNLSESDLNDLFDEIS